MKLLKFLEKQQTTWFMVCTLFIFFLLRLPSLFEPYWYGDEGIYEVIGFALRHGRKLYSGIWDNKPPLLYYIYAIFSGDQFSVRLFSLIAGLAAVLTFLFVARKLFPKNNKTVFSITAIFAFLFAIPLTEGNIANAENFMLFPILLAALFVLKAIEKKKHQLLLFFVSGLLLGMSFLIKVVSVFDFAAFFVFFGIATYKNTKHIPQQIKILIPYVLGFVLPFIGSLIYFFMQGDLKDYLQSAFFSNVGYVGYANYFLIPQGFLIFKLLILFCVIVFIFTKKNLLSKTQLFLLLWLGFAIFDALFSQRSYTHYILVAIPSAALSIGLFFEKEIYKKTTITLSLVGFLILLINFPQVLLLNRTLGYYQNFLLFITDHRSVHDYYAFFDQNTPRDYDIAAYIKSKTQEQNRNIFVWGNNGQIYRLLNTLPPGRYIVVYHIGSKQAIAETLTALQTKNPQFVIVLPNQPTPLYPPKKYVEKIMIDNATIYEQAL